MYKFEISADSPQELREKQLDFARETLGMDATPKYVDDDSQLSLTDCAHSGVPIQSTPVKYDHEFTPISEEVILKDSTFGYVEPVLNINNDASFFNDDLKIPLAALPIATTTFQTLDSRGFPYDARIHSIAKTLNKDGSWRYKKGVTDDVINTVEAEIKNPVAAPVIPPVPATTVHAEIPKFNPDMNMRIDENGEEVYPPLTAVVNPVAVPAQPKYENIPIPEGSRPAYSLGNFKNNLFGGANPLIVQLINEKKISQEYIEQLKKYFEVKELWNILASEIKCYELWNTFGNIGLITKVDD